MSRRRKSMLSLDFAGGLDAVHTASPGAGPLMETYRQAGRGLQGQLGPQHPTSLTDWGGE